MLGWFRRKKFPKVEDLETDALSRPLWPEDVLIAAREGLISSGYCVGAEDKMREGAFDHWEAVQAACYALCNHLDVSEITPKDLPKRERIKRKLTAEEELEALCLEVERNMAEITAETERELWGDDDYS